ncbi:ZIP family zinc transporter [Phyllosticta citriasiana]|uniref:ZIP family zinc transporter n=1 Tax=Phyllosticta citriasiana TaxID=595635 RepID=A0ABR1KR02_9PEZI
MVLDNDTRGWIMTVMSGVACTLGASIICVDIIIRLLPGQRNFKIQDSNAFLSCSLSLSFGVMLFSSLSSMLPSAKNSLQRGGHSPKSSAWILIACFLGGVIGIQILSRIMHQFMPSHVVDCDHSHDEEAPKEDADSDKPHHHEEHEDFHARRPLDASIPNSGPVSLDASMHSEMFGSQDSLRPPKSKLSRRPSLPMQLAHKASQYILKKCDEGGPCHGYTDPCGVDCFKIVQARGGTRSAYGTLSRSGTLLRQATASFHSSMRRQPTDETTPLTQVHSEPHALEYNTLSSNPSYYHTHSSRHSRSRSPQPHAHHDHVHHAHTHDDPDASAHHHHHVPTNAFLSIGLQTSIAIALHKLPEGFITYATNHANPQLGFSVFLALFIHNITEGFALALPLYLAMNSRWKAMVISTLLGGASQPVGAGVAALWFKIAGHAGIGEPGEAVYGGMFAVTAGIMASVALTLFQEAMDLTHSRNLCMVFAFVGMAVLGVSSALTA